jgi:anti-sigma factor RsiW
LNSHRFTPPYNDDAIVAWIDGEMCRADAQQFEEQLKRDERLAGRTDELMKSSQDYAGAFASLLDDAPLGAMQARLATLPDPQVSTSVGVSRRSLIASSVGFLMVGSGLGYLLRPASAPDDENAHIRDLEAQYMSLYSVETLLDIDSAAPVLQRGLERAAQDIGMKLNMSQLTLQGAELKMVRMLRYETTSIAQVAWINADYGPMALCISPVDEKTTASLRQEQRHSMNLVWWHDAGYQFVLIGRNPPSQLRGNAEQLQRLISG